MKLVVLFLSLITLAMGASAGYSDKLKDIQSRLGVSFCPNLSDVQKIKVVHNLHAFLTNTDNLNAYGPDKLVQNLYIECPNTYTTPLRIEAYSRLRQHSLIADYDLASLTAFETRIPLEEKILEQLSVKRDSLYLVRRDVDSLSQTSGSNESHLQLLSYLDVILANNVSADLRSQLDQIVITDTNYFYSKASAALVPSWYYKNKKTLIISVGHFDARAGEQLVLGAAGIEALVKAVVQYGYTKIDTLLVPTEQVESTLVNFVNFLTPDIQVLLQANKVTQITFKENPETAQNLFSNGVLTLGLTQEKMNFVVDLLFR
ncbi:hypothetical protein K2P97_12680 [bacterium]|nr:hypothetical protein [bacterium]